MCVNPIKIRNNRLDWNPFFDRYFNYVPCNHCYDCIRHKKLSYEVLLKSHYFLYNSRKPSFNHSYRGSNPFSRLGNMFYITLTYNPESLPTFNDIPCFSHRHIQLFLKRLRKVIFPHKLDYFIVSEYGGEFGRPHYHCIFFTESFYSSYVFRKIIEKCWQYGFIYGSKNKLTKKDQTIIDNTRPFSYVTKYITKDYEFYRKFEGYDLPSFCTPRIFHSNNFGLNAVNYIIDDKIHLDNKVYNIPLYIVRRLFYNKSLNSHGNIQYRLNKDGLNFRLSHSDSYFAKYRTDYYAFKSLIKFYNISQYLNIDDDVIQDTLSSPEHLFHYNNFVRGYNKLHPIFDSVSDSLLYHYKRELLPFMPKYKPSNVYYDESHEFSNYIFSVIKFLKSRFEYAFDKDNNCTYQANLANTTGYIKKEKEIEKPLFPLPHDNNIYRFITSINQFKFLDYETQLLN